MDLIMSGSKTIPSGNLVALLAPSAASTLDMPDEAVGQMSTMDVITALAESMTRLGGSDNVTYKPPHSAVI
jgi:hypothetical protein